MYDLLNYTIYSANLFLNPGDKNTLFQTCLKIIYAFGMVVTVSDWVLHDARHNNRTIIVLPQTVWRSELSYRYYVKCHDDKSIQHNTHQLHINPDAVMSL